ncbi:MAG TPA: diguanylate cyclase [Kiritimatiellia bacterium]|nr:diguanylate cyclase [Kiritimatiellia bacterium]
MDATAQSGHFNTSSLNLSSTPPRVLILDDEEPIRRLLKMALSREGCVVETAANGRIGLQALLISTFDVAIVDLRMQEMDGITFVQEARKIWPWLGFVIHSGFLDDQIIQIAEREDIRHILTKPVDMKQLTEVVFDETRRRRTNSLSFPQFDPLDLIGHQLRIMRHITQDVLHSQDIPCALKSLGETIADTLPHHVMGILGIEDSEPVLLLQSTTPQPESAFNELQSHILDRYQALSGRHLDTKKIKVERVGSPPVEDAPGKLQSITSVPVMSGDSVLGILSIGSFKKNAFSPYNVTLLYHAAGNLSTILSALSEMRQLATRDSLTGLYNRRQLEEELERAWLLAKRHKNEMAALMLDLDGFKEINDMWGHHAGDRLLKEFSSTLKSVVRASDILGRYGGDEFVILLAHASRAEATVLAERVLDTISNRRFLTEKENVALATSIGIAIFDPLLPMEEFTTLLERADQALYQAKKEGRNRFVLWTGGPDTASRGANQQQSRPHEKSPKSKGRILILDDEEYILILLKKILESQPYEVTVARTISEALDALNANPRYYDILLCDLSLPDGDGSELMRMARELDSEIVNIVISGNVTADNAINALRYGAYDFIQKPIIPETMKALIERALNYRNLLRENARYREYLEDMVRAKNSELTQALDDIKKAYEFTLETMVAMLDAREFETGQHSIRVRDLTLILARSMNCEGSQLEEIGRGALLHDIGKIGIPDSILLKPDKLTEDEWDVMRKHPEIGFRFLKNSAFLQTAAGIVMSHHERWDGTGYPQRLKGEEINIGARIFAVIDAYDAMRSSRVYKGSFSREKTIEEIKSMSGSQFDPAVVDAFLRCVDELEKVGRWSHSFV